MRRRRTSILAASALLLGSVITLSVPTPASAEPPNTAARTSAQVDRTLTAKALPSSVSLPTPDLAPVADECASVKARLPELARAAKGTGKTSVACTQAGSWRKLDAPKVDPSIQLEPYPLWCTDVPGSWVYTIETRELLCRAREVTLNVFNVNTGVLLGQIFMDEFAYEYTSSTIPTFAFQVTLDMYDGWGEIAGTLAQGSATCSGVCTVASSDFLPQAVTLTNSPDGEAFFRSTATTRGQVGYAEISWNYFFTNPAWSSPSGGISATPPQTRCDHNIPGNNTVAGCIIGAIAPSMIYSVSSAWDELAYHILAAQDSGLPGAHPAYGLPNSANLNRLVDATQQNLNYNTSCPSSYTRPQGLSCDEYPFQSSLQGAYTGGGTGRTFSGCQIPQLPTGVTGPTGYSACMIDATMNSEGGTALGSFYIDQRVLNADPFYVWIAP